MSNNNSMNITNEIVRTRILDMSISKVNNKWEWMKISIHSMENSPYGWTKRNLMYSPFGLEVDKVKSFNDVESYIRSAIYHVYKTFPQEEIGELLNKIKEKI